MTKQKLFLYLLFLVGMAQSAMAQEPYAVLSHDNTVLTFYYDAQKAARGGMSVGPFESTTSWYPQRETIATVVFDASFADCTSLTSTAYWFLGCTNLTTISGIENLKTDNVTDMSGMFFGCSSLTSLDVSGFKTDNVTDMRSMFSGCKSLTSIDLSGFKTENVTSMSYMFYGCESLTSLDLSGFKTDNVTDMSYMFSYCSNLTYLNLSGFKTDNVTNMGDMFSYCSSLRSLDLSGFKTDKVMDMSAMFYWCSSLTTIYASNNWSTEKVTKGSSMFNYCTKLVGGQGTAYKSANTNHKYARIDGGTAAPGFFTDKNMPKPMMPYAVLSNDGTVLTFYYDTQWAERGGKSVGPFENQSTRSWHPQRETIATVVFDASFADCTSLTSTAYWFYECTKLNTISGIENLKTENVTNMRAMFHNCSSLTSLDLSNFKTDKVTDMSNMFYNCSSLTSLDLSSFKTNNVTNMRYMFYRCKSLTSLDVSGFKTDNVMDMTWMFGNCSSLTTIYASNNWSTGKVTDGSYMFYSSTKLVGGQGTAYDASHTDYTYARIDGGTAAPGYFTEKSGTGTRGLNADSNADNAPVYDLSGRRVQVPAKGIYVKNGKKFVNK